ncbi:MAG: hypothetical protein BJ554DRAFT_6493 [Olpidium bornovanus]|uniref:sulfiredoxin n=1 Tax=Olpidium bornovanus TaxID=278681 RepID=A0A8H8DK68_9FUNG|nr:MAG: hypothetical protein BJ554DRAFT_6493 [Olpidium bornovanus]
MVARLGVGRPRFGVRPLPPSGKQKLGGGRFPARGSLPVCSGTGIGRVASLLGLCQVGGLPRSERKVPPLSSQQAGVSLFFFSPTRGLSGKAPRLLIVPGGWFRPLLPAPPPSPPLARFPATGRRSLAAGVNGPKEPARESRRNFASAGSDDFRITEIRSRRRAPGAGAGPELRGGRADRPRKRRGQLQCPLLARRTGRVQQPSVLARPVPPSAHLVPPPPPALRVYQVYDIPMAAIQRPIPSVLDNEKVDSFVKVLQDPEKRAKFTPIDVAWVEHEGKDYYYAFGGCHRCVFSTGGPLALSLCIRPPFRGLLGNLNLDEFSPQVGGARKSWLRDHTGQAREGVAADDQHLPRSFQPVFR